MVHSLDEDTDFFDIVTEVLQGNTLAPYLFRPCRDYALQTSIDLIKENSFELKRARSRRYPAKTITNKDDADDLALLANTLAYIESFLHSLKQTTGSIGYANKTESIRFK